MDHPNDEPTKSAPPPVASDTTTSKFTTHAKARPKAPQAFRQKLTELRQSVGNRFYLPSRLRLPSRHHEAIPPPNGYRPPRTQVKSLHPLTRITVATTPPHDLFHTTFLLRQLTLPELAVQILDHAGFYGTQTLHAHFSRRSPFKKSRLTVQLPGHPLETLLQIGPISQEILRGYRQVTYTIQARLHRVSDHRIRLAIDAMSWGPHAMARPPYKVGDVVVAKEQAGFEITKARDGLRFRIVCGLEGEGDPMGGPLWEGLMRGEKMNLTVEERLGIECEITDFWIEVRWKAVRW